MHDAITLEKAGIPTVAIITSEFIDSAKIMAKSCGISEYGFAIVEHPISSASNTELEEKARESITQAERLLVR
ncbi:MAG: hypothetical protein CMM56_03240 [Rhodospirillaceae bacterium]|nr:hypothetical protein [Rhodospirillaceae bacterium]